MKQTLILCFLVLGLGAGRAHATTLQIDSFGILTGATGVMVNGIAHDVRFQAGSCNVVFDGCDPAEDLFFTSGADALAASQALLDQVFLGENLGIIDPAAPGLFDDHPGLTQGCTGALNGYQECIALTPYAFVRGVEILTGNAINYGSFYGGVPPEKSDQALLGSLIGGFTPTSLNQTYAVWSLSAETPTAVPEPSTLALLGAGLTAFVRRARRTARITPRN